MTRGGPGADLQPQTDDANWKSSLEDHHTETTTNGTGRFTCTLTPFQPPKLVNMHCPISRVWVPKPRRSHLSQRTRSVHRDGRDEVLVIVFPRIHRNLSVSLGFVRLTSRPEKILRRVRFRVIPRRARRLPPSAARIVFDTGEFLHRYVYELPGPRLRRFRRADERSSTRWPGWTCWPRQGADDGPGGFISRSR